MKIRTEGRKSPIKPYQNTLERSANFDLYIVGFYILLNRDTAFSQFDLCELFLSFKFIPVIFYMQVPQTIVILFWITIFIHRLFLFYCFFPSVFNIYYAQFNHFIVFKKFFIRHRLKLIFCLDVAFTCTTCKEHETTDGNHNDKQFCFHDPTLL